MKLFWKSWGFRSREGTLIVLRLPRSWKRVHNAAAPIAFKNNRDGSLLQITPLPTALAASIRGKLREAVAAKAEGIAGRSVGGHAELCGMRAKDSEGWYFIASDRNVRPGEWAHMIAGMIEIDLVVLSFTILSHQTLRMGEGDALDALNYIRIKSP